MQPSLTAFKVLAGPLQNGLHKPIDNIISDHIKQLSTTVVALTFFQIDCWSCRVFILQQKS